MINTNAQTRVSPGNSPRVRMRDALGLITNAGLSEVSFSERTGTEYNPRPHFVAVAPRVMQMPKFQKPKITRNKKDAGYWFNILGALPQGGTK